MSRDDLISEACKDAEFVRRFESRVDRNHPSGCHLWIRPTGSDRYFYGEISFRGVVLYSHRVAWCLKSGSHPGYLYVCHTCDVKTCVNPDHLWLGTMEDNIRDMYSKGRNNNYGRRRPVASKVKTVDFRRTLKPHDVAMIRAFGRLGVHNRVLASAYHVDSKTIRDIFAMKTWKKLDEVVALTFG